MERKYVTVTYRLRGDTKMYSYLNQLAGTNRYLWNQALGDLETQYKETGESKFSYFDLCKWYTNKKQEVDLNWLKEYPAVFSRTGLKDLSIGYKSFLQGKRGFPKYKSKHGSKKSFAVEIVTSQFSKEGYFQFKRGLYGKLLKFELLNRYSNPTPKLGRIYEGRKGKWYLSIQYEVDAIKKQVTKEPVGIDRNVRQCYDSNGIKYPLRDLESLANRIILLNKWKAKKVKGSSRYNKLSFTIASHYKKISNIRDNELRHIAKEITSHSDLVILEDLKTKNLTKSARGTIENPGKNVKQKSGLNRVIQDSGWYKLEKFIGERAVVHKVDPKYTSKKCSECGHVSKDNRKTQSKFKCMSCNLEMNADWNAALNILASGIGTIKTGRGEYSVPLVKGGILKDFRPSGTYSMRRQSNTESSLIGHSCM